MQLLRFRVAGTFDGKYCVGQNLYDAGQEFTLREDQARRWISTADIEKGYVIPLPDVGTEHGQYIDSTTMDYVDGKDGDLRVSQDFERFTVTLYPTFSAAGATSLARFYPDCDCTFLGVEFPQLTPASILSVPQHIDVRKYTNGTSDGGSMLEYAGNNNQMPTGVVFYDASAGTYTDYTSSNTLATAGGIVLSSMQTTDYLYIGWYAPFDGFTMTGSTYNSNASVMTVSYPKVAADGSVTWTSLSATDLTALAGATLADPFGATWDQRPGDWKRMVIGTGTTYAYWVRVSVSAALDSSCALTQFKLISKILPGYDNAANFIEKGDMVTIDSPVYTATSNPGCTATNNTAQFIVLHFARVR